MTQERKGKQDFSAQVQGWNNFGSYGLYDLYFPVLDISLLTPEGLEWVFRNIRLQNKFNNEIIEPDDETFQKLMKEGLTREDVAGAARFSGMMTSLTKKGINPSILRIPSVEDWIDARLSEQRGARIEPAFLAGIEGLMKRIEQNPGKAADILAEIGSWTPISQEKLPNELDLAIDRATRRGGGTPASALVAGLPNPAEFTSEKDYQQARLAYLTKQGEGTDFFGAGADYYAKEREASRQTMLGETQQRIAALGGGAKELFTPESREEDILQERAVEAERTRTAEEARLAPIRAAKARADAEWQRLVAQSRRPQRRISI